MLGKKNNLPLILLLCAASLAVYFNSLRGEFLIDDYTEILKNENIHNIKAYFSTHFSLKPGILIEVSRVFLWYLSGGSAFVFHLFNLIAHAACVVLLFFLFQALFSQRRLSFLAALIFALHPIHTEAVSWVSGGGYAFSAVFFLAALLCYIRSDISFTYLSAAVVFFLLCLLTANTAAALPPIFLFYDLFFRPRHRPKEKTSLPLLRKLALLLVFLAALAVFWGLSPTRNTFVHRIFYFRGLSYLVVSAKAFLYYLKILYLPIRRGLYHPFAYTDADIARISPSFFAALAAIIFLVWVFLRYRKRLPALSFGTGFLLVTYLPYSNIIPACNIISERYMYLPSAGFCLAASCLFWEAWEIINRQGRLRAFARVMGALALTLYLLSYCLITLMHNRDYRDLFAYWESNINNFPEGYMAYNNLAGTCYAAGKTEQAIGYCWITLAINPRQPHVWCNLAKVYREKGNLKMARYCYRQALAVDKDFTTASKGLEEIE